MIFIFLQCSRKEVLKSWNHEYQVSAKERERSQLSYEAKKDLEELDAAKAQEDAIFVGIFENDYQFWFLVLVEQLNSFNDTFHFVILQLREKNEKDERRRRTLANAVKQARAAQWIKDNIIANQVNRFENVIGSVMTASKYFTNFVLCA